MSSDNTYDVIPYQSRFRVATHPDSYAVAATLAGMSPAPVDRCRVLELGCSTGGNLLSLAVTLPGSRFLGLDLSERQIAVGRANAEALGLGNLELRAQDLEAVDASFGEFDYIICHGVFSWVSPALQWKILQICKRNLAPQGVAYLSYNTYPGWHLRGAIREMLIYHIREFSEPAVRLREARAFLEFLLRSAGNDGSAFGRLVREEADLLKKSDAYFFHEHLEDSNQPLYFHQFAARGAEHGLQYLAEVENTIVPARLPPESRARLDELAPDFLAREQYLDFVSNRAFRRSLLCHADLTLDRNPPASVVTRFLIASEHQPTTPNPDLGPDVMVDFASQQGPTLSSHNSIVKATLLTLHDAWPSGLTFAELWSRVCARLEAARGPSSLPDERGQAVMQANLLKLFESDIVRFHTHMPHFVRQVGERPEACPLARLVAGTDPHVPCRRVWHVEMNPFERLMLRHLDGRRTLEELIPVVSEATAREGLLYLENGTVLRSAARIESYVGEALAEFLQHMARSAMLV